VCETGGGGGCFGVAWGGRRPPWNWLSCI